MIVAGDELVKSDALEIAAEFAEAIGAAAYQQSVGYGSHFLAESACYLGSLSRDQKSVRDLLAPHDLMIALGSDPIRMSVYSEIDPKPDDLPVVHVGLVDWDIAKNFAVEIGIKADVRTTLEALVPAVREIGGAQHADVARARVDDLKTRNWSAKRETLTARISTLGDVRPIDPDWLSLAVAQYAAGERRAGQRRADIVTPPHGPAALPRPPRLSCAGLGRHRLGIAGLDRRCDRPGAAPGLLFLR